MSEGWAALLEEAEALRGEQGMALRAYSEFMPAPRVGWKPCGEPDLLVRRAAGPAGFAISEYEQTEEIAPGLERIAQHVGVELNRRARGEASRVSRRMLTGNAAWPGERPEPGAGDALVVILSLALSRTQDDKGRVRWTLFGTSHDGPARAFWRSFARETAGGAGAAAFRRFVGWALGSPRDGTRDLRGTGVRVLPMLPDPDFQRWRDEPLPDFVRSALLGEAEALDTVRAVVTFRPFAALPEALRRAYLAGAVRLIPSPASLVFFHEPGYRTLARALPRAMQIPLLHLFERSERLVGVRIPQSGWLHETPVRMPGSVVPAHHVRRTHRWQPHGRHLEDVLAEGALEAVKDDHVTVALFSTAPEVMGLYDKPMARNAQIWDEDFHLLLDGPRASGREIAAAARICHRAGRYGYRFVFPPMRAGARELFWHLPLALRVGAGGEVGRCPVEMPGVVTAEREGAAPIELVPRMLDRPDHRSAIALLGGESVQRRTEQRNVRKILEWSGLLGRRLTPSFARRLITVGRRRTFAEWLAEAAASAADPARAGALGELLRERLGPERRLRAEDALTFARTRERAFEQTYWNTIAALSDGRFTFTNNADVVAPEAGGPKPEAAAKTLRRRQLEAVRDHVYEHYARLIARHGMEGRAVCADHVFRWETDFDFPWWGGWARSRAGEAAEFNVVVVIPGRERGEAVVMGDHFDTAYMEDLYDPAKGGDHTRVAARGADDNHSATAALLMAADTLLPLARDGKLARDVWLVHLTGEEFPADCLGSRALVEALIRRDLVLRDGRGASVDLSATRVAAAFILDMVAHNNDREHNVFQIAPGDGAAAARLAVLAHQANERWNAGARSWNVAAERRGRGCGRRVLSGEIIPPLAEHPEMAGQIRPEWDPHSALYNTDAQIFSDAGVPVVLFMEDYDLNRHGYHDSEDTMANIDLDYGAALVAIAIETVAQAACAPHL
jgi:hypothetical protein